MTSILSPKLQIYFSTATKTRYCPLQYSPVRRSLPRISHATTTNANQATERESLKNELKNAVAATKRGKKATPKQQTEILNLAEQLEKKNPTSDPALSPLISGRWSLLYIGPGQSGDVDWQQRTGGIEGPFLAFFQSLTRNAVKNRGITQIIEADDGKVQNLAEYRLLDRFEGFLNVEGTVKPVQVSALGPQTIRVDVNFTAFNVKIGRLPALSIPLTWPKTPKGFVDTTYLDEDFRLGRGDKGSLFVTARRGKE